MSFCQVCSKCFQCCQRAGCRGQTSNLLAQVARSRCKPKVGLHFEGRLCSTVQNEAPSDQVSFHQKWLRKPGKKPFSDRGLTCLDREVGSQRAGCKEGPLSVAPVVIPALAPTLD